jgi:hypothetical protein
MLSDSIRSALEWLFAASVPSTVADKARLLAAGGDRGWREIVAGL